MRKMIAIIAVSSAPAIAPGSASALPIADLEVTARAVIHDIGGIGTASGFILDQATAGPLSAELENGAVLAYDAQDFPPDALEATLFQTVRARADYGTNSAVVTSGVRPTSSQDRGDFPSGPLIDLELNSSAAPEMRARSEWVDTFVIDGGTGTGMASVTVELDGSVESGYGRNGTGIYNQEITGTFEAFGRNGSGTVRYTLQPRYDGDPFDFGSDGPPAAILFEERFSNQDPLGTPFPDILQEIDGVPTVLTGDFLFEYGVPFALESSLDLFARLQIDMDYFNTASLSLFTLPAGATLTSGSGHLYPVFGATPPTPVPEPAGIWLLGAGLLVMIRFARSRGGVAI